MKHKIIFAVAATAFAVSPTFAATTNAASSLSIGRAASPSAHKSKLGQSGTIVVIGVVAAIGAAIAVIATDSDKNRPAPASR